ncbi:MAG: YbaB/EbfC family nucleoid-associated protein [Lachnospiraceae bacterium]|nr:YbaB/EbfC family nucleoid-associated protein [Lachnospiraceae bacterium]
MAKHGGYMGGMSGMNMNNLMKQAQKMQAQMQQQAQELETKEFKATSGGGAVSVTVSGRKELKNIEIAKEAVDPEDVEMLQDMIMAAVNDALHQVDGENAKMMGGLNGLNGLL